MRFKKKDYYYLHWTHIGFVMFWPEMLTPELIGLIYYLHNVRNLNNIRDLYNATNQYLKMIQVSDIRLGIFVNIFIIL